jgi:hypothetical protein
MQDVENGNDPKGVWRGDRGMLEVDTFHGHIPASQLEIGPRNLPSSLNGAGLIRDRSGKLVFG